MKSSQMVRTRIAPSPTGPLHVGTARTALFNYLFARKHGGEFLLRIEDTDRERSDPRFEENIREGLTWLGLQWDGAAVRQSERTAEYRGALERLFAAGKIFWCAHTPQQLKGETQMQTKTAPRHHCNGRHKQRTAKTVRGGVLRFRNDKEGAVEFTDLIRGLVTFQAPLLGDFSVAKGFDEPLYNLAAIIDDTAFGISHVIRGEDHISNTPKQLLLAEALGVMPPQYAHLPLLLGMDRSKLSKRHGSVSINEYRDQGFLSDSMVNFLALLGWHGEGNRERYSLDALVAAFTLEGVQRGGAVFDEEKLRWMNREYLKDLDNKAFRGRIEPFLKPSWREALARDAINWEAVAKLVRPRSATFVEAAEGLEIFFEVPRYPKELLLCKSTQTFDAVGGHLTAVREQCAAVSEKNFSETALRERIMPYAEAQDGGRGMVLWPFRVALSGKRGSPDPFAIAAVIGKVGTLARLDGALSVLA